MTLSAPPRPPRPGDPVERDELEALVNALIEEARRRARRRRLLFAAVAAAAVLVGVMVFAVFDRPAQSQTASPGSAARSGLPGTTSSTMAFITELPLGSGFRPDLYPLRVQTELFVMNADGSGKKRLVAALAQPQSGNGLSPWQAPAWSPDGRELVYGRGGYLHLMNADGSGDRRLARDADAPAWSPDGRTIAFSRGNGSVPSLYVMNADGSGQRQVTPDGFHAYGSGWSPDGQRIIFGNAARLGNNPRDLEVFVVNVDGSGLRNLTGTLGASAAAWSPDGRTIAFSTIVPKPRCSTRKCWEGSRPYIYLMNADGSEPRRLVEFSSSDGSFGWSPDGQKMVFVSNRDGNDDVYTINIDGSGLRNLTRNPGRDGHPVWSPDGRMIAFVVNRGGNHDIYVMNADDGTGQRNLTSTIDRAANAIAWSPTPKTS